MRSCQDREGGSTPLTRSKPKKYPLMGYFLLTSISKKCYDRGQLVKIYEY